MEYMPSLSDMLRLSMPALKHIGVYRHDGHANTEPLFRITSNLGYTCTENAVESESVKVFNQQDCPFDSKIIFACYKLVINSSTIRKKKGLETTLFELVS